MNSTKDDLRGRLVDYLHRIGTQPEKRGRVWKAHCPLHEDTHPSLEVEDKGDGPVWHCFPCGRGGDLFALHLARRGGTFPEALREVAEVLGTEPPRGYTPPRIKPRVAKAATPPLPPSFEDAHRSARVALYRSRELQERFASELGLSVETIRRACFTSDGLGFSRQPYYTDKEGNRKRTHTDRLLYLYPSGAKVRHPFGPGSQCRFLWSVGTAEKPWRAHLLERPEVRRVILVESESEALACLEAGLEDLHPKSGDACAVVASPGTSFKEHWGPLFTGKAVTLALNGDEPGLKATERVTAILRPYAERILVMPWKGEMAA